jgi:hypothetical protein
MGGDDSEDEYMDGVDIPDGNEMEVKANRKRKLDQKEGQVAANFNQAKTTDEKLTVMFGVLIGLKKEVRAHQESTEHLNKEVKRLKQTVYTLQKSNEEQSQKISELEEKTKFLLDGGQLNLILHGLKELPNENIKQRVEESLLKIFGKNDGIREAFRIGKQQQDTNKPRAIKIRMTGLDAKLQYTNNIKSLISFNKSTQGDKLLMFPDSTQTERALRMQTQKALVDIKKTDTDARIKRGVIISKGESYRVSCEGKITKLPKST